MTKKCFPKILTFALFIASCCTNKAPEKNSFTNADTSVVSESLATQAEINEDELIAYENPNNNLLLYH